VAQVEKKDRQCCHSLVNTLWHYITAQPGLQLKFMQRCKIADDEQAIWLARR